LSKWILLLFTSAWLGLQAWMNAARGSELPCKRDAVLSADISGGHHVGVFRT
jgi:hypothetical protein